MHRVPEKLKIAVFGPAQWVDKDGIAEDASLVEPCSVDGLETALAGIPGANVVLLKSAMCPDGESIVDIALEKMGVTPKQTLA